MNIDEKVAIVILSDLKDWQKLKVVSFLASSVAIQFPNTHGKNFVTASGSQFLPFAKHPILIYKADNEAEIKRCFQRARERGLQIGIYTRPLFATKNEEQNLAEIAKLKDEEQDLVGVILYGESKAVTKSIDALKFHP